MDNSDIVETVLGNIKIVKYNKPKRKNAIDISMYQKITKILNEAAQDENISVTVLTGSGDYYSSGNDLIGTADREVDRIALIKDFIEAFIKFPKLLIAVVNGPAIGIAATTLPLCDLVFAAEHAFFLTPFTKLGIVAEGCSTFTFPRVLGDRKALEMLLFNHKMSAKEALECGFVNYLYKPEELQTKVWDKIMEVSKLPKHSITATKKLIRNDCKELLQTNIHEIKELEKIWESGEYLISIQNFINRKNKELYTELETDPIKGLTNRRAHELLLYYGYNKLTPASNNGMLRQLFESLCTGFSILIWFGAFLCLLAYLVEASTKSDPKKDNLYLGCVLIGIDVLCGLFSFFQNYKSSKIMKMFNNMLPEYARSIRDGVLRTDTHVHELVKGDIVRVQGGDIVPADIRVIDSMSFKVDNSSLTGESVAVPRSNTEGTSNILESPNVAFFSTQCVQGWAVGVVISTGDLTALGRVAGLAARLKPEPSPLSRQISRFMKCMSVWAVGLGLCIGIASFALGYPFMEVTIFVIGIIVANIPEGLAPTVTAALTLTAKNMVKRNCLVKNLDAVEALGACTTICSDKTGTLTENKMCVWNVWLWNQVYLMPEALGQLKYNQAFDALKICGSLCSTASLNVGGAVIGDASETAIMTFLYKTYDPMGCRKKYPKLSEIPFNSLNKYQVSVHLEKKSSKHVLMMKGAPECISSLCATVALEKGETHLTPKMKQVIDAATETLANTGQRILAFADLYLDPKQFPPGFLFDSDKVNFPLNNLRFIGLIGLIDPPRAEVASAIGRVRAAGVKVLMVTGDHPATARAIAAEVGIATTPQCHVITGLELRELKPELLEKTLSMHNEIVFARTSPTQKLQIVEACQRLGGIVAVTGDGVNDAPALRRADIGISMGITGSQVSKQTADIILMDDNFATIVVAIEEGRKIYDNLKKSVCYILISNVPEIFPVFLFILFSIPLPLGAMTILCIDLGTDMWPAVSLSFERAESDVMGRPPRNNDPLVSARMVQLSYGHIGLIEVSAGMFAYFVVMAEHGFYPSDLFGIRERWDNEDVSDVTDSLGQEWTYAERKELERACQASYFVAVVLMQMMNGVIGKTRYNSLFQVGMSNKILNAGLIFEFILAIFLCYTPQVNTFFKTYPILLRWWFLSLPFLLFMFVFDEFRKYCIRKQLFGGWYNKTTLY